MIWRPPRRPGHDHHVRARLDAAFTGSQIIRTAAMVQLLLGNIGVRGGGMNALRGHSNIQGLTDLGLMSNLLPGYLTLPGDRETDYDLHRRRAPKPCGRTR
jgi:formate dehydrogenase major subunit